MTQLLINGVYDLDTLEGLKKLGVTLFSFDLRGRSLNLVKMNDLLKMSVLLPQRNSFLIFDIEKKSVILSFLDLLKDVPINFDLVFFNSEDEFYFRNMGLPFYWVFHPESDWQKIVGSQNIKGLWLPLKFKNHYVPELWEMIDEKKLDIYLYAENFFEASSVDLTLGVNLCIDLTSEVESYYRKIDLTKLKKLTFWEHFHEATSIK